MGRRAAALLALLCLPAALHAAAEAGGHSAALDFLGKAVNFLILFGGLALVLRKPLAAMLDARKAAIRDELDQAASLRAEAEDKRRRSAERLSRLDQEVDELRREGEARAAAARQAVTAAAEQEKERILSLTRQEMDHLVRSGVLELRGYVGRKATEAAAG
jgi:F-type H+-transporting ATPase subunit b